MKLLCVVEDNMDSLDLMLDLLGEDYEIKGFSTGPELLEYLETKDRKLPVLFILDISLPVMDGMALLRKLKADRDCQSIPALALTAHAMKNDRRRFLNAGFDGYLSKPIVEEKLLFDEIDRLLKL